MEAGPGSCISRSCRISRGSNPLLWIHIPIFALLTLGTPAFSQTVPPAAAGVGAVSVTVFEADERQPMPGVRVELTGVDQAREAFTDAFGRCQLDDLSSGGYDLRVEREGYHTIEYVDFRVSAGRTTTIEVQLDRYYSGPTGLVPVCEAAKIPQIASRSLEKDCLNAGAEPAVEKMRELGEHSIKSGASDASFEAYRFIWRRSFQMPVIVSVSVHGGGATLKTYLFGRMNEHGWGEPLPTKGKSAESRRAEGAPGPGGALGLLASPLLRRQDR